MELVQVYRITTFVPPEHLDSLKQAICSVDSLSIGPYEHVMWSSSSSKEQFRPTSGATPTAGAIGELAILDTVRLEFCIPRDAQRLQNIIENGIYSKHPWEVPAVFVDESILPMK
jgi:hypothetical protein